MHQNLEGKAKHKLKSNLELMKARGTGSQRFDPNFFLDNSFLEFIKNVNARWLLGLFKRYICFC